MTHPARHRRERQLARPARRMRITADTADLVTLHAQLLAGTAVAARARGGIATRLATVLVLGHTDPARRMRARAIDTGDALRYMTRHAAIRLVASLARARIGLRFEAVPRREASAMHARRERIGELLLRRQRCDGHAVAARTRTLAVTRRADVTRRRRTRTVIAQPIAIVREMARRQLAARLEVLVAAVA